MQLYKDFQPTGFDCKGLALPNQQDWLVAPVSRNRDSDCLTESNWASQLETLGGESDTCEVHRFGHWANGWFEIVIVHPDRLADVEEIESSLEDYPVLNDSDFSNREHAEYNRAWESFGWKEFVREITRAFQLSIETDDRLTDISTDALLTFYESLVPSGDYYSESYGFRFDVVIRDLDRSTLAAWIKTNRVPRKVLAIS